VSKKAEKTSFYWNTAIIWVRKRTLYGAVYKDGIQYIVLQNDFNSHETSSGIQSCAQNSRSHFTDSGYQKRWHRDSQSLFLSPHQGLNLRVVQVISLTWQNLSSGRWTKWMQHHSVTQLFLSNWCWSMV